MFPSGARRWRLAKRRHAGSHRGRSHRTRTFAVVQQGAGTVIERSSDSRSRKCVTRVILPEAQKRRILLDELRRSAVSAGFDGGDVYLYGKGRFNTSSQRNTASINDWASILDKKMLIVRIPGCVPLLMVQEAALDRHPVTEVPVFTTFAIWRAQRLQLTSRWRILNTAVLHRTLLLCIMTVHWPFRRRPIQDARRCFSKLPCSMSARAQTARTRKASYTLGPACLLHSQFTAVCLALALYQ